MATLKTTQAFSSNFTDTTINSGSGWNKFVKFADGQKAFHAFWWLVSLMVHCILVPCTFLLVYSLNGSTAPLLAVSMVLFFINVVGNMGGAGTRFTISAFFVSLAIHLMMIISVLL